MSTMQHTVNNADPLMGAQRRVVICAGTGCVANGAMKVHAAFQQQMAERNLPFILELREEDDNSGKTAFTRSGCQGFCQMGPLVTVLPENILYTQVKPGDVDEIIETSLIAGNVVERLLYSEPGNGHACKGTDDIPFYTRKHRRIPAQWRI
jgi:NADH-quinone oxidoreductase subunit F